MGWRLKPAVLKVDSFLIGSYKFNIPTTTVRLAGGERVRIQCVLSEEPDPDCYAQECSYSDDTARLVIRLRGTGIDRTGFDCIIHSLEGTAECERSERLV
jgi:hypothetical protein